MAGVGGFIAWRLVQQQSIDNKKSQASNYNCCNDAAWRGQYGVTNCDADPDGDGGYATWWEAGWYACRGQSSEYDRCDGANDECKARADGQACPDGAWQCTSKKCTNGVCGDGGGTPGECTIAAGDNCCCGTPHQSGCATNCKYADSVSAPQGKIANCNNGHTAEFKDLTASTCKDRCEGECGTHDCPADFPTKVYSGPYIAAARAAGCDDSDTANYKVIDYGNDCPYCGNPMGCLVCCKKEDAPPPPGPSCGDGECNQTSEACEDNQACPGWPEIPAGQNCRSSCTFCGDGKIQSNHEACEVGDPDGHSCDWASCDHTTCQCPGTVQNAKLAGQVVCKDGGAAAIPIANAQIDFYHDGTTDHITTGADGFYTTSVFSKTTYGGFALRFMSLPSGDLTPGWAYSNLVGPQNDTVGKCNGVVCAVGGSCTTNYEWCSPNGLTYNSDDQGATNGNFDWVFTNCSATPPSGDWSIVKNGAPVCYEEGTANVYAEITYTITVTNNTSSSAALNYVEDTYDSQLTADMIISASPTETSKTGGKITWTGPWTIDAGGSKTFTYTVRVPKSFIGKRLLNTARAQVVVGGETSIIEAQKYLFVLCTTPDTGIFDSTAARIGLGIVLISLGFAYYKFGLFEDSLAWLGDTFGKVGDKVKFSLSREGKRKRWEGRVIKGASRRFDK